MYPFPWLHVHVSFYMYLSFTQGPLARDTLYAEAEQRIAEVREKLMKRKKRYQEFGDYRILQTWLLSVRGISLKEPLKMATPPLI